ncbi:MAG TPA: DUF58 domain-containing protein [Chitinophagaceae bacterium]
MGRLIKNIRGILQPAIFFIPVTYYFFLFAVALAIANSWLSSQELIPGNSFTDIFKLLVKTGIWFLAGIIGLALLSVFISFIIFTWKRKRNNIRFSVSTTGVSGTENPVQKIHVSVSPILKPFLGFIKLRLQYDGKNFSDKFALAEAKHGKLISFNYGGDFRWNLPQIKEYHVTKLLLYFEDFFQFFSFTVALPVLDRFHTHPFSPPVEDFTISPRKTEETTTRIEELKKVEGEYLHYKNFEDNDDVRRIVWKIYAKNKDLVVRIPEILDPYASHAYMYVSFYNNFDIEGNATAEVFFLNYYKSVVWAIYQKLGKEGFDVKYIADQKTPVHHFNVQRDSPGEEQQAVQYTVTTSNWQKERDIKSLAGVKDASVIVLSSMCNAEDAESLFNNRAGNTVFILVRLSKSLHRSYLVNLLQWLFIQQEKNDVEVYKTNWRFSLLRPKILQNEKRLEAVFAKQDKVLII